MDTELQPVQAEMPHFQDEKSIGLSDLISATFHAGNIGFDGLSLHDTPVLYPDLDPLIHKVLTVAFANPTVGRYLRWASILVTLLPAFRKTYRDIKGQSTLGIPPAQQP